MKKFFKSIPTTLSYIIFPRKIGTLTGMSMIFGFLLFVSCLFIGMTSSSWTVEKYVTKSIGGVYYMDFTNNEYEYVSGDTELPKLKFLKDSAGDYYYAVAENYLKDENGADRFVYSQTLKNVDTGKETVATFVYELEYLELSTTESEEEPDIKISDDYIGTYSFVNGENNDVIDILNTGEGYYNGSKITCTQEASQVTCSGDNINIIIKKVDAKYEVTVNSNVFAGVSRIVNSTTLKFDLNGYFHQMEKYDPTKDEVLIIYTRNIIYYLFNRGYTKQEFGENSNFNFIMMPEEDGTLGNDIYEYYLPADAIEATKDATLWTKKVNRGDTTEIDGKPYTAYNKVTNSLSKVFSVNVPLISYNYTVTENEFEEVVSTKPIDVLRIFDHFHVVSWGDSINYSTSCERGLPFGFLIPLICIIITWVMSRKRGNLKTFKEYFNLAAFAFIPVALLEFILGFFIQYTIFKYFTVVLQLGVFIFYAYRINSEVKETPTSYSYTSMGNETLSVDSRLFEEKVEDASVEEKESDYEDENPNLIG